jgi:hypothetical protein
MAIAGFIPGMAELYSGLKASREQELERMRGASQENVARIQHPEFLQQAQAGAWNAEAGFKDAQGRILVPAHARAYDADTGYRNQQTAGLKQAYDWADKDRPSIEKIRDYTVEGKGIANRVARMDEDYMRSSIPDLEKRRGLNIEGNENINSINLVSLYEAMNKAGLDTSRIKERIAGMNSVPGSGGVAVPSENAMSYAPGNNNIPNEPTWRQHPLTTGTAAVLPYAMGAGGAVLGSTLGPAGTVLGGTGGGMAGQYLGNMLTGKPQSFSSTTMGGVKGATVTPGISGVSKALPYAAKIAKPWKEAFVPKPNAYRY